MKVLTFYIIAVVVAVIDVAVGVKGAYINGNGDGNEHGNKFKNFELVGGLIAPTSLFRLNNFLKFLFSESLNFLLLSGINFIWFG